MKTILLSFDLEEFDVPFEHNFSIPFEEQIEVSQKGSEVILDLLDRRNIKATFFSTYTFASHSKRLITKLCESGHELASHGYFHSQFEEKHLMESRLGLEELSNQKIVGFRMPRMMPVDLQAISNAGYVYDSSLNPTYIPGRYNHFAKPRLFFRSDTLWELPASVTPYLRVPLFWLAFHHFPLWFYKLCCQRSFKPGNYLNIYFHPWEFTDLHNQYGLPKLIQKNTGSDMIERFELLLDWMMSEGYQFSTIKDFIGKFSGKEQQALH